MSQLIIQYKIGTGIPSLPGNDYMFVFEVATIFGDYDLITAGVTQTEDYGGVQL